MAVAGVPLLPGEMECHLTRCSCFQDVPRVFPGVQMSTNTPLDHKRWSKNQGCCC